MEDNVKELKIVENIMIVVLLFVIIIILLPSVSVVMNKSLRSSAEISTKETAEAVKELYININLIDSVNVPFKVIYDNEGYTIYSNGIKYTPRQSIKIESEGKMPTSGSVEIDKEGFTTVKDLKFGIYKCNQIKDGDITCEI